MMAFRGVTTYMRTLIFLAIKHIFIQTELPSPISLIVERAVGKMLRTSSSTSGRDVSLATVAATKWSSKYNGSQEDNDTYTHMLWPTVANQTVLLPLLSAF